MFRGRLAACTKFKSDGPIETINPVNVEYFTCHCYLFLYIWQSLFTYHTTKPNIHWKLLFCKRIKPKIMCNPYHTFGIAKHLVTLTLYMALPLYHLEEMCHPDLTFWPALPFGTWEYPTNGGECPLKYRWATHPLKCVVKFGDQYIGTKWYTYWMWAPHPQQIEVIALLAHEMHVSAPTP